jgi:hypothetical protein
MGTMTQSSQMQRHLRLFDAVGVALPGFETICQKQPVEASHAYQK